MSTGNPQRILVPVGESVTLRQTVAYIVRKLSEETASDETPTVAFVFPASWQNRDLNAEAAEDAEEQLERVRTWVYEDLDVDEGEELPIQLHTDVIGTDEFLFSPSDYADTILEYARKHGYKHIVLDPDFKPGTRAPLLSPLVAELELAEDITFEEAPVERSIRGRRLLGRSSGIKGFLTVFGLTFLFYQIIGGFAGTFDYITGAVSAAITAAVFSGIVFDRGVNPVRALRMTARWLVYIPYLFWEIAKANLEVVYIVLHPSMPIDPSMERFRPAVPPGLPVTTLANSITLTPGTVTVDVYDREFYVHSLTRSSRESLLDGGLERAVRFVFFGRNAMAIASPRERAGAEKERQNADSAEEGKANEEAAENTATTESDGDDS